MKKLTALSLCCAMVISMAACGSEPGSAGNSTAQSTDTQQKQSLESPEQSDPAPEEPNTPAENPEQEGGLEDFLSKLTPLQPSEEIAGTTWDFAGGMLNGAEMGETEASQVLETYNGALQIVFGEEGAITMVQGSGNLAGTYSLTEDGYLLHIIFDNAGTEITYAGLFADVNGDTSFMLFPDETGQNAFYFIQSADGTEAAGGSEAGGDLAAFISQLAVISPGEDIFNTGWEFAGGTLNGAEMDETAASQVLEAYGGTLRVVFGEEGAATMIQGGGSLDGAYSINDDGCSMQMVFGNAETQIPYTGLFAYVDDTVVFMLFPDGTDLNVFYFAQINEN